MPSERASDLARRRSLRTAALGFALLDTRGKPAPPKVQTVRKWLDNWRGVGDVVTGMNRRGFMLHLSNVDTSTWRATFDRAPMLSSDGFGSGRRRGERFRARRGRRWGGCQAKTESIDFFTAEVMAYLK